MKKNSNQGKRPSSLQASKLSSALNSYLSLLKNNNPPKPEHSPQNSYASIKKRPTPSPNSRATSRNLFQSKGDITGQHYDPNSDIETKSKKFESLKQPLEAFIKKHKKYDTLKENVFAKNDYGINSTVRKPNEIPCIRHPEKKAKYTSSSKGAYSYFCSKCAISYALEGYKVEEMESEGKIGKNDKRENAEDNGYSDIQTQYSNVQSTSRSDNNSNLDKSILLNDFLKVLTQIHDEHSFSKTILAEKKEGMSSFLQNQISECETIFDQIQKILEDEKISIISKAMQSFNAYTKTVESVERDLGRDITEMCNIKLDIEVNMDNILKNMELEPLKVILQKYEEKLHEYSSFLDKTKSRTIPLKLLNFKGNRGDIEMYLKQILTNSFETSQREIGFYEDENGIPDRRTNTSVYVSFENKEFFEEIKKPAIKTFTVENYPVFRTNSKSVDKPFSSPQANPQSLKTFKTLKGSSSTPRIANRPNGRNLSSDSSKYLNLLDKIQVNQENTNNSILESQQKMIEVRSSQKRTVSSPLIESEMYSGQEKKDNFYNFIEKKLNDEEKKKSEAKEGESYQKTLFSSPQFKDVGNVESI